jgi:hypothetical protein
MSAAGKGMRRECSLSNSMVAAMIKQQDSL